MDRMKVTKIKRTAALLFVSTFLLITMAGVVYLLIENNESSSVGNVGQEIKSRKVPSDSELSVMIEEVNSNPTSAFAHARLGLAYAELGQYQKAVNSFEKVIRLEPRNAVAYDAMGFLLR